MTKLNDTQERVLQSVKAAFADTLPALQKMEEEIMEKPIVSGIALDKNQVRVVIS